MKVVISAEGVPMEEHVSRLKAVGLDVIMTPHVTEAELIEDVKDADAIIVGLARVTRKLIDNAKQLKIIGRLGVGVENIDVDAATKKRIPIAFAGDANAVSVAEHTLCLLLAFSRHLFKADELVREGKWLREFVQNTKLQELNGKTLGIVGFGRIGRNVADRARSFGMRILAYDPIISAERVRESKAEPVDIETLLKQSDYITLHAPATKDTYHIIGEKQLGLMKKTAILINCARGILVDEVALANALAQKRIGGAAIDVFEPEPPQPDNPLFKVKNTILTPHTAWYTDEALTKTWDNVLHDVIAVLMGTVQPKFIINPQVLER